MSVAPIYAEATPVTKRGLDANVWGKTLSAYASNNPLYGNCVIDDDFNVPSTNTTDATAADNWFIQDAAAGGTSENFSNIASPDGVRTLSAATGTDHFGIEAHYGNTATALGCVNLPSHSTDARGRVVYQCRVDLTDVDQFFIGLTEPIVQFLSATSTLPATSDYIGFFRSDAGALQFVTANDNAGGTAVTDSYTLLTAANVPTGNVNLAFAVNADKSVDISVNGVYHSPGKNGISTTSLPIESLTAKFAITRGATGDLANVSLPVDLVKVFVEANEA